MLTCKESTHGAYLSNKTSAHQCVIHVKKSRIPLFSVFNSRAHVFWNFRRVRGMRTGDMHPQLGPARLAV